MIACFSFLHFYILHLLQCNNEGVLGLCLIIPFHIFHSHIALPMKYEDSMCHALQYNPPHSPPLHQPYCSLPHSPILSFLLYDAQFVFHCCTTPHTFKIDLCGALFHWELTSLIQYINIWRILDLYGYHNFTSIFGKIIKKVTIG